MLVVYMCHPAADINSNPNTNIQERDVFFTVGGKGGHTFLQRSSSPDWRGGERLQASPLFPSPVSAPRAWRRLKPLKLIHISLAGSPGMAVELQRRLQDLEAEEAALREQLAGEEVALAVRSGKTTPQQLSPLTASNALLKKELRAIGISLE